jgi:RHS repeat-associated protein
MFDLSGTEAIKDQVCYTNATDCSASPNWTSTYDATNNKSILASPTGVKVERWLDSRERPTTVHFVGSTPSIADATITYDSQTGFVTDLARGSRSFHINYGAGTAFVTSIVDNALNRTWTYNQRDSLGRPLQETLPGNRVLNLGWDNNGNMTSLTPPKGQSYVHTFTPNSVDLLSSYSPPNVGFTPTTTYSYDRDSHSKAIATPGGTINYAYDYQGRIAQRNTSFATTNYSYDTTSGLLSSVSSTGAPTIQYEYKPNGSNGTLPTKVTYAGMPGGGGSPYVQYTYDNRFRLSSRSISGSNTITYNYDDDGVLSSIALPGGINYTITRAVGPTGTGLITSTTLSGSSPTVQNFTYNTYAEVASVGVTVGGASKYGITYNRDAGGRLAGTYTPMNPSGTKGRDENLYGAFTEYDWTYAYDTRGFLTTAYATDQTNTLQAQLPYSYDSNGNLTGGSFDLQDRQTNDGYFAYSYTNNGEISYADNGCAGWICENWSYSYDVLGNLWSASHYSDWTFSTDNYAFVSDGLDRRIARKVNGVFTQQFLYDESDRVIAEYDGSGNLVSQFVYATHSSVPDVMVRSVAPTGTYVFIHDQLGSPRMLISSSGTIAQYRIYDPWGNIWLDQINQGGFSQPFGFAGGLYDDAIGYRFGARDYNPATGRWYSKDRALVRGGANLYAYCMNDPINCYDPLGRAGLFVWGSFGGENPGPMRAGAEAIAIGGYDHELGYYNADIVAATAAAGGEANYVGGAVGLESSGVRDTEDVDLKPITIFELGIGPEIPEVAGISDVVGIYVQNEEWGWFWGVHGAALGDHGGGGIGIPLGGRHGLGHAIWNFFFPCDK